MKSVALSLLRLSHPRHIRNSRGDEKIFYDLCNVAFYNKSLSSRKAIEIIKISRNEDTTSFLFTSFQRLTTIIAKNMKSVSNSNLSDFSFKF